MEFPVNGTSSRLNHYGPTLACPSAAEFLARNPNVDLNWRASLVGSEAGLYTSSKGVAFLETMAAGSTSAEVLSLDAPWVGPAIDYLETLNFLDTKHIRKKYIEVSPTGDVLGIPYKGNQLHFFFRKDLFKRHGLEYPDKSIEQFNRVMMELQTKERAYRRSQGDPNADKFYALGIAAGTSANRITFVLLTLLTTMNGPGIVTDKGHVVVNNPTTIQILEMWKGWHGTLMDPENLQMNTNAMRNQLFREGYVGAGLMWASNSKQMYEIVASKGFDIGSGPVPGPHGAGCSGHWVRSISVHTRDKAAARDLLTIAATQAELEYQQNVSWHQDCTSYITRNDPVLWKNYCTKNPIICEGNEKYPEFWERIVHRPSRGTGPQYSKCTGIIFENVWKFFRNEITSAECAAGMEKELQVALGFLDLKELEGDESVWTSSRIALTVVVVVCSLLFIGMIGAIVMQVRSMRKPSGCSVPISVLLGLIMTAMLSVALGVIISKNDESFRNMSESLAESVRKQSLLTMHTTIDSQFQSLIKFSTTLDLFNVKAQVIARIPFDINLMDFDPRSLVLLVDREFPYKVLFSSDENQQENRASLAAWSGANLTSIPVQGSVSAVLAKVLEASPGWGDITTVPREKDTVKLTADGKAISANLKAVDSRDRRTNGFSHKQLHWLLIYITPDDLILSESKAALDESLDLSILIGVVTIVVTMACSVVIASPLVRLASNMEHVRVMNMAAIVPQSGGILLEMSALSMGFTHMCDMLVEYRAFLPKTVLAVSEDEDDEDLGTLTESVSVSRAGASSSRGSKDSKKSLSSMHVKTNIAQFTLKLNTLRGAVLVVSIKPKQGASTDEQGKKFSDVVAQIELIISTTGVTLHTFNAFAPNQLALSAGMARTTSAAHEKIARVMMAISSACGSSVTVAANSGKFVCGNVGTNLTRGFGVMGSAMESVAQLLRSAEFLTEKSGENLRVVGSDFYERSKAGYTTRPLDILVSVSGSGVVTSEIVYHLIAEQKVAEEEWMYQLESIENMEGKKQPVNTCFTSIKEEGTVGVHIQECLKTFDSLDKLDQAILNSLKGVSDCVRLPTYSVSLLQVGTAAEWVTNNKTL